MNATDDDILRIDQPQPGCTRLTLNRPRARNALSRALRQRLTAAIDGLAGREEARVLILTGAGQAFCAGLDLKELGAADSGAALAFDDRALNVMAALRAFPGPIIGAINGPAITGGFELALACDVLVCSHTAQFADTHARVGILAAWGLSQRLSRAVGVYRARELSLTGNFLSAAQAQAWGLVNRVVDSAQLLAEADALAAQMLSVVPSALVAYKKLINDGHELALGEAMALEHAPSLSAMSSVDPAAIEQRRHEVLARAHARAAQAAGA